MRVLVSLRPFVGHLHPCIPLTAALRAAGHEVAVATAEELATSVSDAGLPWFPAGMHPRHAQALFTGESADYGFSTVRAKVEDLLTLQRKQYRPDVVLREPTDMAPALAAEILGIPCVAYSICHFIPRSSWQKLAGRSLAALRSLYGLHPDPALDFLSGALYVDVVPPTLESLDGEAPPDLVFVRYEPSDAGGVSNPPPWVGQLASRPTVLITMGTVYNKRFGLLETFLAALADEDVNVVCTVGQDRDPREFGSLSDKVHVESYVPHSMVLPYCQALLCHGGFNTTLGALCAGVPVVCVPVAGDQFYNARRCSELGLGLQVPAKDATPAALCRAVRRLLDERSFAHRVSALCDEVAALPSVGNVVRRIEETAGGAQLTATPGLASHG